MSRSDPGSLETKAKLDPAKGVYILNGKSYFKSDESAMHELVIVVYMSVGRFKDMDHKLSHSGCVYNLG